jgi:hypothetical protein
MKKFIVFVIVILFIVNFIVLYLGWLGWQLDYKQGSGFHISMIIIGVEDAKYAPAVLDELLSGINFDILYFAGFSIILSLCLFILTRKIKKEKILTLLIVSILVCNFVYLYWRWYKWQQVFEHGLGQHIKMSISKEEDSMYAIDALNKIFDMINFDYYYYASFTLVLSLCVLSLAAIKYINFLGQKDYGV